MAGGQGGGKGNRPFTGGLGTAMGQMGGGGPGYGQQQRTTPQMPAQSTYQQNAPYPGGFAPAAPGAQMMQAGQATPYQMNYGFPAGNFRGVNGMMGGNRPQGNSWYGMNPSQMRPPPKRHPVTGQPVTPPVTDPTAPPVTDPATPNPYLGMASDVYGHVVGDGTDTGDGTVTPDPVTGQPRSRHGALAQQIAALRDRIPQRREAILGKGYGTIGSGDPKIDAMRARLQQLNARRYRLNHPGAVDDTAV